MTRAGREPAEDVKPRLVAACQKVGLHVKSAAMQAAGAVRGALLASMICLAVAIGACAAAADERLEVEDWWTPAIANLWTPERIESVERSKGGMPPGPWVNDSFLFGGTVKVQAGRSQAYASLSAVKSSVIQQKLLPDAVTQRYAAYYIDVRVGSVIPVLGRLYCLDRVSEKGHLGAFRLTHEETPDAIVLRPRSYVFPLYRPSQEGWDRCATLTQRAIRVQEIRLANGNSHGSAMEAKVGITRKEVRGLLGSSDVFDWTWLKVGDFLTINDRRHEVLSIVPPDEKDRIIRGRPCRLIGWIEIEAKPSDQLGVSD